METVEQPVNSSVSATTATSGAASTQAAPQVQAATETAPQDLKMVGRFARYMPVFWQIILPFLSARYLFEGTDILFDLNHKIRHWKADDLDPAKIAERQKIIENRQHERLFGRFKNQGVQRWVFSNLGAISFGGAIAAITAYYTNRTYKDIKTLSAEAVGYEKDKDPESVTFRDMVKSKNVIVKTTMHALINRTIKRFGAGATFFVPWGPIFNPRKYRNTEDQLDNIGLKMGTGVMGFYLFTDGFLRKQSLFESIQGAIAPNSILGAGDVQQWLNLDKQAENKTYIPPLPGSDAEVQQMQLASAIAEKMNHTYKISPPDANLTMGKFIYMLGFDMLNSYPASLGFVELASKSQGMNEVKTVAAAIKNGQNPEGVFREFGVDLNSLAGEQLVPQQAQSPEQGSGKYANMVGQQAQSRVPAAARSPQDFVTTQENSSPHLGM